MGSVAGRFGNSGQADYSAANEAMAQVCRARGRALHICWTAWSEVGMASRGGMDSLLTRRGVDLLPATAGAATCVDLILAGAEGELVIAGSLGDMEPPPAHPLTDALAVQGDRVVLTRTLDTAVDTWLLDHAIDGTVVVPGVVGVELMAAAATQLGLGQGVAEVVDVRFDRPAKLHRGQPLELQVEAVRTEDGVRCVVRSHRTAATGRAIETEHFSGLVRLGSSTSPAPLPPACFPDETLDRDAIYERFFHGPTFQVLGDVESVTGDGLLVKATIRHAPIGHGLLTAPMALEAAFQAAGLHTMIIDGVLALPAAFDQLVLERPLLDGQPAIVTARRANGCYDVDVDGPAGRVLALRGFRMIERGPLPDGDSFELPEDGWADAAFGVARVVEKPQGILGQAELAVLTARGTPSRQADRVAGRLAAKRAVAALTGAAFPDIRIDNAPSGEPIVTLRGAVGPALSISHSGGRAVAVASWHGRVGVDLEQVRTRHPAFAEEWFSSAEQARFGDDPEALTLAWAAKEATLKALGIGMAGNPRQIEVERIEAGRVHIALHGELALVHEALGGGRIAVWARVDQEEVLVGVRLAA
jgi:phosphopantetheinyl transferase